MKHILTSLAFASLAGFAAANDTLATAESFNVNSSKSCSINPAGDVDYFRVNLTSAGEFLVNTTGTTDTYGQLLNSNGTVLFLHDDVSASNRNFSIRATLAAGTYYVKVRHYSSTRTGDYVLVNAFTPAAVDDHGNTVATATRLTLSSNQASRAGVIGVSGDIDVFVVTLTQAGSLQAGTTGSTDTVGALLNSSSVQLATNDDVGSNRNFSLSATVAAGTYYITVRAYGSGTGSYTLNLTFTPTATNPGGGTNPPGSKVALLVGINDYISPSVNDLGACVNDVNDIGAKLISSGWRVTKLTDRQATKAAIRSAIKTLSTGASQFLFYYSGHGTAIGTMGAICPADTTNAASLLTDTELRSDLATISASTKISLVFDSCNSGLFIGRSSTGGPAPVIRYHRVEGTAAPDARATDLFARSLSVNGYVVITGCRGNQYSYEVGRNGWLTGRLVVGFSTASYDTNNNRSYSMEEAFAAASGGYGSSSGRQDPQLFDGNGTTQYEVVNR